MNTRRYPRTLQEAFGPYTSAHIYEPPERGLQWTGAVVAVVLLALLVLL